MTKQKITRLTGLSIEPDLTNLNNALFYLPNLSTAQVNIIEVSNLRNGAMYYDITDNMLKIYLNGAWRSVALDALASNQKSNKVK